MNGSGEAAAAPRAPLLPPQQGGVPGSAQSSAGAASPRSNQSSGWLAQTTDVPLAFRAINTVTNLIHWSIENRLGAAKLFGALVVPAQFANPDVSSSQLLAEACNTEKQKSGHVVQSDTAHYGDTELTVAVCYPPGWPTGDTSRCALYHNPNAVTIGSYFQRSRDGSISIDNVQFGLRYGYSHSGLKGVTDKWATNATHCLGIIQDMRQCPVIFYDYRGVGINKQTTPFFPTCETIVQDGLTTLHYALTHFNQVEIFGTSLGGAVATASLDRYPSPPDSLKDRVKINVLDSFTTTAHVLFPEQGPWIDNLGWLLGAYLDGAKHADNLIHKDFKIAVSNHTRDEVIPPKAQLATHILAQAVSKPNVQVHLGGRKIDRFLYFNHGSMTEDVQQFLNKDR